MTTSKNKNGSHLPQEMTAKRQQKPSSRRRTRKRADHEGTIYFLESRNRWVAQVYLGKHPGTGKAIFKRQYTLTQREARAALEDLKDKYRVVTHVDADTITTSQWLNKWFDVFIRPKVRDNTAWSYRYILDIACEEVGHIKLDRLTDIDLQAVIFGRLHKNYRTAKYFRTLLKAAMKRAVKSHLLKDSPAEDLELPPQPPKKPFVKPSPDDWEQLLSFDKSPFYCWRWILLTEFVTGARMSEVLGLQWEDFTFERGASGRVIGGKLHIQHALIVGQNEGPGKPHEILLRPTKTAQSNRVLPLPPDYCQEMLRYRKHQLEIRLGTAGFAPSNFVFTTWQGAPINPGTFSSRFAFVRKKLGIKTTFHMLRHDMASRMKNTHLFDLKDIQAQLGHSSIQITMDTYTHIDDVQSRAVTDWLEMGLDQLRSLHDKDAK